jgi:anthranilate/para-aminobenzoate synthase component II
LREFFESLKTLMRDGESYLANASTRLYGPKRQDAEVSLSAFVARWVRSPSRYGVYVGCGSDIPAVVCFSPERFVQRCGSTLVTEPIKGTARVDDSQPFWGALSLWNSTKEMCEQKMVTDLLRNDLNSLCVPGSVCVEAPFAMRRAGDLLQMQSVVSGQLQNTFVSAADVFRKMLPAGSVTGTPKYAVGQQLRALERTPRGYYTGVFALADDAAHFESTLLIRGFFAGKDQWEVGIGAGITTLSDLDFELEEFELKWQSFAQRWPNVETQEQSFSAMEECQKLLSAKNLPASPYPTEPQPHPISVVAPLIELTPDAALNADELCGHILFVDHLDSFSGNLLAALRAQGAPVARVVSAPAVNKYVRAAVANFSSLAQWQESLLALVEAGVFVALVLSPGPGRPQDYSLSKRLLRRWPGAKPLLGVCLGHQLLLEDAGCALQRVASTPVHGRSQRLHVLGNCLWLAQVSLKEQECTFYNSWNVSCSEAVQHASQWQVCAVVDSTDPQNPIDSGDSAAASVALCEHRSNPWIGVQFHPESFATVPGKSLLAAFVALCRSGA